MTPAFRKREPSRRILTLARSAALVRNGPSFTGNYIPSSAGFNRGKYGVCRIEEKGVKIPIDDTEKSQQTGAPARGGHTNSHRSKAGPGFQVPYS
jgi:hypothetical protein